MKSAWNLLNDGITTGKKWRYKYWTLTPYCKIIQHICLLMLWTRSSTFAENYFLPPLSFRFSSQPANLPFSSRVFLVQFTEQREFLISIWTPSYSLGAVHERNISPPYFPSHTWTSVRRNLIQILSARISWLSTAKTRADVKINLWRPTYVWNNADILLASL